MHMSDALLSLPVGGALWGATAGLVALSVRRLRSTEQGPLVSRMGIMAAFVFASQMINFTLPGTGSSGHLGGGLLLAAVLGPWAAFLAMASVLLVQAMFFADGGLLAWGANVFNLGFFTCFLAFPLVFKPIAGNFKNRKRVVVASVLAAVVGLQLGSLGVVLQTTASGISALPFSAFLFLMQPIHLAIGAVEGMVTAGVLLFLMQASPESLPLSRSVSRSAHGGVVWGSLAAAALLVGGVFSWFASQQPDGLEWSVGRVIGQEQLLLPAEKAHAFVSQIQEKLAFLPDYAFAQKHEEAPAWPQVDAGTSTSGVVGGIMVAFLTMVWAFFLKKGKRASA
jgi:cobalt/nickel transport system permease protein